jgi:hypothetical protein
MDLVPSIKLKMHYRILHSTDQNQIGYNADEISLYRQKISQKRYSTFHDLPREGRISTQINLPPLEINTYALKADLLMVSQFGGRVLVVSERAKTIIAPLEVDNAQWLPLEVWQSQQKTTYFALYLPNLRQDMINWGLSSFSVIHENEYSYDNGIMKPIEESDIVLKNYQEYLEQFRLLKKQSKTIVLKEIKLASDIPHDLFRMSAPFRAFICSSFLKRQVEEAQLTGFKFEAI